MGRDGVAQPLGPLRRLRPAAWPQPEPLLRVRGSLRQGASMNIDLSDPIGAARWQLCHAIGRLEGYRKYPAATMPVTLEDIASIVAELEQVLSSIRTAHNGEPS